MKGSAPKTGLNQFFGQILLSLSQFIRHFPQWMTNVKALQIFQIIRQGAIILIAILLAQSQISQTTIGEYEMLLYLGYVLSFAWVSGLVQALLSMYPTFDDIAKRQLITQTWLVFVLLAVIAGSLLLVFPSQMASFFTQNEQLPFVTLFGIFLIFSLPASLQEYFYLLDSRPLSLFNFGWVTMSLQVVAVILPVYLGFGFKTAFYALITLGLLKWLWTLTYVLKKGNWQEGKSIRKKLFTVSWPLILSMLLGAIALSFDPWFVAYFYQGEGEEFAIYRYGARELPFVMAVAGALGNAMIPVIAATAQKGVFDLREKSRKLFHFIFPFSILLMLTSQWWFVWLFGERFAESIPLFNTLLLLTSTHLIATRTVLVALKDTKILLGYGLVGIAINIGCTVALTPIYGLMGVVYGTLISFFIEKILIILRARTRHKISLDQHCDLKWWGGYTLVLILCWLFVV